MIPAILIRTGTAKKLNEQIGELASHDDSQCIPFLFGVHLSFICLRRDT